MYEGLTITVEYRNNSGTMLSNRQRISLDVLKSAYQEDKDTELVTTVSEDLYKGIIRTLIGNPHKCE